MKLARTKSFNVSYRIYCGVKKKAWCIQEIEGIQNGLMKRIFSPMNPKSVKSLVMTWKMVTAFMQLLIL